MLRRKFQHNLSIFQMKKIKQKMDLLLQKEFYVQKKKLTIMALR